MERNSVNAKWIFCFLHLQLAGLRKTLDTQVNRPLLMFWPTDYAINNLPVDFQNKLRDPQRVLELIHFIQYHVVAHIQVRARGMFYRKQTTTFIFKVVPCKTMFAPSIWSRENDKIYNIGKFWSLHDFFTLPARHRGLILDFVCFPKVRTGLPARSSWKFCQNCPQKSTTFEHTIKE